MKYILNLREKKLKKKNEYTIEDIIKLPLDLQWLLTGNMFIEIKKKKPKKRRSLLEAQKILHLADAEIKKMMAKRRKKNDRR